MPVGKKARVGVLSAGSWCSVSHIPELLKRDDVQLVVVTREEPDIARWTKERFGFQYAGSDWRKALDEHELDVVVVGSPAAIHYEQVKAALESGAHVLAEKPFTLRSADAWDLIRTAERLSRHIVVALGWNYSPMVLDARELLRSRGVGEIEHVTVNFTPSERPLFFGSEEFAYPGMNLEVFPNPATYTDRNYPATDSDTRCSATRWRYSSFSWRTSNRQAALPRWATSARRSICTTRWSSSLPMAPMV